MSGQVRATSSAKMAPLLMEVPWQPVIVFPLDLLPDLLFFSLLQFLEDLLATGTSEALVSVEKEVGKLRGNNTHFF